MTVENDDEAKLLKLRFRTICEVQARKITGTQGAERLGVSRKTFYEYMAAFVAGASEALKPGDPGRPKLSEDTVRLRQLEKEKKKLEAELYELRAVSELQQEIIQIRNSQLAEREKKRK